MSLVLETFVIVVVFGRLFKRSFLFKSLNPQRARMEIYISKSSEYT